MQDTAPAGQRHVRGCNGKAGPQDLQTPVGPEGIWNLKKPEWAPWSSPLPNYRLSANLGGPEFGFMNGHGRWPIN